MIPFKAVPVQYDLIRLGGGLDQVTPTLSLPPGVVRRSANFEANVTGGYTRVGGYERFDGRPNPSDARYAVITGELLASVSAGDSVTGGTSGATGKVIKVLDTGIVVTRISGYFAVGENILKGLTLLMVVDDATLAANAQQDVEYLLLAANDYRSDIEAVPGEGPIRGVAYFNGDVYAWRNAVGNGEMAIWKSSSSGWAAVNLGYELFFDTGSGAITSGQTVTGATSGASAEVVHVVVQSGDWTTSDAAGFLSFQSVTGTFVSGENLQIGGVTKAKAIGTADAVTLQPDGRVDTVVSNFGGYTETPSLYGADGVNPAFELYADGRYVRIYTGANPDAPQHVIEHKNHLFLSYGSSIQHSALGNPHDWKIVSGAGEIALNAPVTEWLVQPGDQSSGAMAIYTRSSTYMLYGTSSTDWNLTPYNIGTGAIAYTGQNMSSSFVLDDRGVINLATTLNYGNFDTAALTLNIRPFIQARRNLAVASCVNREKSQYRVFFSDGTAIYLTLANGKMLGAMPIQFPNKVTCIIEGEKPDGSETSFFGSDNGFVYRLDAGTSFDGDPISASLSLVYNSISSPRILKRFRKGSVELTGESYAEIDFGYDLGYRSKFIEQPGIETESADLRASYWDEFSWDRFVWDGGEISPTEIEMNGTAENLSIRVSSVSNLYLPFTVNTIILHYTPRRGLR